MTEQITSLDGLSDEEIRRATNEGRLDALLSGDLDRIAEAKGDALVAEREAEAKPGNADLGARGTAVEKYDEAWLRTASPKQIEAATRTGKLNHLL